MKLLYDLSVAVLSGLIMLIPQYFYEKHTSKQPNSNKEITRYTPYLFYGSLSLLVVSLLICVDIPQSAIRTLLIITAAACFDGCIFAFREMERIAHKQVHTSRKNKNGKKSRKKKR